MANDRDLKKKFKFKMQMAFEETPVLKRLAYVIIPACLLILLIILLYFLFNCCFFFNCSIVKSHILAVLMAIALMFAAAIFFSASTASALIIAMLLLLLGFVMYNPLTNTIPIKFLEICNGCKVSFYENFQTGMSGVCAFCQPGKLKPSHIFDVFPDNMKKDAKKTMEDLPPQDIRSLLGLTCSKKSEFLNKLTDLKRSWLVDVYKRLEKIEKNESKDSTEDIKCIKQELNKIILIDQVVLIASEKTLSSCSCGCNSNASSDRKDMPQVSVKSSDIKEFLEMHLNEMQINKSVNP